MEDHNNSNIEKSKTLISKVLYVSKIIYSKYLKPLLAAIFSLLSLILKKVFSAAKTYWKLIGIIILIAATVIITLIVVQKCSEEKIEKKDIVIENTPIQIEDVRPRGEIYVCSSIIEDFTTEKRTEKHLGLFPEEHSCVQILRQKVSYKIDLNKITYTPDTLNIMIVDLPDVEYVASTQKSPFMSDDEEYWIKEMPNTNALKRRVAKQIQKRFDTLENRKKAEKYAQDAVRELLKKLGYEARFTPKIEKKKE